MVPEPAQGMVSMASVIKLTDKPRKLPWRAKVKGGKVRMFATKDEAERWGNEYERTIRLTGLPPTIDELKKHTVGELVERYLKEKTPLKGSAVSEKTVLEKFLKRDISRLSLAAIKKSDAYKYRDDRLKPFSTYFPWLTRNGDLRTLITRSGSGSNAPPLGESDGFWRASCRGWSEPARPAEG
jgi:hypothetical protein